MQRFKTWTLTDVQGDVWLDSFAAGNDSLHLPTPFDWSLRKRTLRGGLRDGLDVIEVHNGVLAFSILPTRGMNLWRGDYRGNPLGWRSPIFGPVHPKFVQLTDRGGIGWLAGFDELLCRCGLASNGPPGDDNGTPLTLHGRISNSPAHTVEVRVHLDPPYELSVSGEVEEAALFSPQFRLSTTYTTVPGSNRLVIHDVVTNRAARAVEMQLLYHCNLGPPFLEAGSRVLASIREMAPQTSRAAEGIDTHETYAGPVAGFAEQVYLYDLLADARGHTLALLMNRTADRAVALRFHRQELPCFTVWKNTGAIEEGYVTGLEPATNYPNFKGFERQQGRVAMLPPGGRWECRWMLEVADNATAVSALLAEVAAMQAKARAVIHRAPHPRFSPV
ncbi:MAG: aldose 1-epimerase family protein, partial [Gemmataceae bacterium]